MAGFGVLGHGGGPQPAGEIGDKEAARGDTEAAFEILDYVERDSARLEHFRSVLKSRLENRSRRH